MGWKGAVRSIQAEMRRIDRENARQQKIRAKMQALDDAQSTVRAFENYIENITSVHADCASEIMDWQGELDKKPPAEPKRKNENEVEAQSKHDVFKPSLLNKLLKNEAKKRAELAKAIITAAAKDENVHQDRLAQYRNKHALWEKKRSLAERLLQKEPRAYLDTISELNPFETIEKLGSAVKFSVDDKGNLTASINVHGDDVIPKEKYGLRQSGTLSTKEMPKGEFNALYQDYVCSCALRVAAELYALLPIEQVLINAKDDLLNSKTGHIEEQIILSVMVMRKTFEALNLDTIDPSDAMKNFVHNMRFKKATGFDMVEAVSFDKIRTACA
jgi:hypothetical protein